MLKDSAISPKVARQRGYRSVTKKSELKRLGFSEAQRLVPGLLIPIRSVDGKVVTYQLRPDKPRSRDGKAVKYETRSGTRMLLDVPRRARKHLDDPSRPLFITEGAKKADAAVSKGLCCAALLGVTGWRGTNVKGGKVAIPDWESVALEGRTVYVVFDSDVTVKRQVHAALARLKPFLERRNADVRVIYLPPGEGGTKVGLDDYLAAGHTVEELLGHASAELRSPPGQSDERFVIEGGSICHSRAVRGEFIRDPLCNFTARVVEELVLDDGLETHRAFVVKGRLDTGATLPRVRVPVADFAGMGWVTKLWV
jgi:hypothetical protein